MYDDAIVLSSRCSSWEPVITNAKALKKQLPSPSILTVAAGWWLKNVSNIPSNKRHAKPLA